VDPIFGTLDDFRAVLTKAHSLGLKVLHDQVWSARSTSMSGQGKPEGQGHPSTTGSLGDPKPDGTAPNNCCNGRRPGVDVDRAAGAVLPAPFPEGAA